MKIRKVDSKSIILHEETKVKFKTAGKYEKFSFLLELTKGVPYRTFQRKNIWIKKLEKLKRERNQKTVISLPKVSERVSTN